MRVSLVVGMRCAAVLLAAGACTSGALTDTTPPPPPPASVAVVAVQPPSATLEVGDSLAASATPMDSTGAPLADRPVVWSSSDSAIATVSALGAVSAIAPGSVHISATSDDRAGSIALSVRPVPVASLTVTPTHLSLTVGGTQTLTATPTSARGKTLSGRSITWTTANAGVARVSPTGVVTAIGGGSTTITASCEGKSAAASVTVTVPVIPVASVSVAPQSATLQIGATVQLVATPKDASGNALSGRTVIWTTSNSAVATVSNAGLVTAQNSGTASITATSEGKSAAVGVTVTVPPPGPVATVTVAPATAALLVGAKVQLAATEKDAGGATLSGRAVSWTTSNSSVATVSGSGLVTAKAAGSATITATSEGKSGTSAITVSTPPPPPPAPVATVIVSPASASIVVDATQQLTATTKDAGGNVLTGRTISWASSNLAVATVSAAGLVTAISAGSASITATSESKSGSSSIAVTAPSGGGGLATECSSPKTGWLWCDDFEQDRSSSYFEYNTASGSFSRASGVGVSGSTGMKVHFAAGQTDAGDIKLALGQTPSSYFRPVDAGTAKYRELYWRIYLKNQPGWTGGGGGKLGRVTVFAKADWSQAMIAHTWTEGASASETALLLDPASGTDDAGNVITQGYNDFNHLRWLGAKTSSVPMFTPSTVGQWYCVEVHVKLNTAGASDGVEEMWVNGTKAATASNLNFLGAYSAYGLNAVFIENYWNNGSPVAQERYIDNLVVSTQPIGCS